VEAADWTLALASPLWRFSWGALGGVAPEIVRLYKINTGASRQAMPVFGRRYLLISVAFVTLAGFWAVAWGDNNPLKCLYVGAALPSIVSFFARQ
jgi:hypothetical protein